METADYILEKYPSGTVEWDIPKANGKRHGLARRFFPNGALYLKRPYVDGKAEGQETMYYKDGTVRATIEFRNGKKNGWYRRFSEAGVELTARKYVDDELAG